MTMKKDGTAKKKAVVHYSAVDRSDCSSLCMTRNAPVWFQDNVFRLES